ncbi:DUF791-domain-containing protein [Amylostereum chailletii]|nr:DUF791-domain-containing protein [Amylostereum chailletii]
MALERSYASPLIILSVVCVTLVLLERRLSSRKEHGSVNDTPTMPIHRAAALKTLMRKYLMVYALVMGADWLQGPYLYSLYSEQYGFPEEIVAVLFVTGFLSAALFAPLMGTWADQYGRKRLCLVFCGMYAATCMLMLFPFLPLLVLSRILGGISTSILFSAFESWLISANGESGLRNEDLSTIMGRATLVNGFVATVAGVVSNKFVEWSGGGFRSPFVASGAVLVVAGVVILDKWSENFVHGGASEAAVDVFQLKRLSAAVRVVAADPELLVLGLTQTIFEGSMYIFVFIWVPALQETSPSPSSLPLGFIFSSFMVSMILGSLFYTFTTSYWHQPQSLPAIPTTSNLQGNAVVLHVKLSSFVCAAASLAFATCVHVGSATSAEAEHVRFWAFCAFEACVGLYYPVQGMLRGALIANEHRATMSALFRVPLNVFVVVSLLTGASAARELTLSICAVMLGISSITTAVALLPRI